MNVGKSKGDDVFVVDGEIKVENGRVRIFFEVTIFGMVGNPMFNDSECIFKIFFHYFFFESIKFFFVKKCVEQTWKRVIV